MQLPQSVFGIRSNTVVFVQTNVQPRPWRVVSARTQFGQCSLSLPCRSGLNWVFFNAPKMLSSYPFCAVKTKDNEATRSTPRTAPAHRNIYQEKRRGCRLYFTDNVFYMCPRTHGCDIISLWGFCWGCLTEPGCCVSPWPLRWWGPRVVTATCTRYQHQKYQHISP